MRLRFLWPILFFFAVTVAGQKMSAPARGIESISLDETVLVLPCPPGYKCCGKEPSKDTIVEVRLRTKLRSAQTKYRYTITAGEILGTGSVVRWNLEGQPPGTYKITAIQSRNEKPLGESKTATVTLEQTTINCDCVCPTIGVSGPPGSVKNGDVEYFTANISGGPDVTYNWIVENAEIVSGQGTSQVKVRVKKDRPSLYIKGTVKLGGLDPACNCPSTASATALIVL